jgi:serine phosphatase RsbU (regulator of sigma subunit)/anti-sigma regulatory factor (Ser/Thr protein kinase)
VAITLARACHARAERFVCRDVSEEWVERSCTVSSDAQDHQVVARSRSLVRARLAELGLDRLADDAQLVTSEIVTNAVLHGGGCQGVDVVEIDGGVRIEVEDRRPVAPVLGLASTDSMTGRGMRLVATVAARWGVEARGDGKVIWAEITDEGSGLNAFSEEDVLALWGDDIDLETGSGPRRFHVVLGDVPTDLLVAAKSHVDNVVRELTLASSGARDGMTSDVSPHLASLIDVVANRFVEARDAIKRQALAAAATGALHTRLELDLGVEAADAGEEYLRALDALDAYCRAARLLTLETPPQHRLFRHWYVGELIAQLRALAVGATPPAAQTFEVRLLQEIERVAAAQAIAERSARLYAVAGALASAATPEAVANAVLEQGVPALGASGGGLLLPSRTSNLVVRGSIGYGADVVARLESETLDDELPAAVALRTGTSVWIESRADRDAQFPGLLDVEPSTVSICAVPLDVPSRRLGALRFSFSEPRLFDESERQFVLTLAAQAAQALERAQLQQSQIDASRRLQRGLLPPSIPQMPGIEAAASYRPLGDGIEVGGDFYDVWHIDDGTYALAIGDVVGTGPEAAALATRVRFSLRALTLRGSDASSTLEGLNAVLASASSDIDTGEVFCTVVFVTLRRVESGYEALLASGGHPYPLVRRADGSIEEVVLGGSLLGVLPHVNVALSRVLLEPGDMLVLFTDGVTEARTPGGVMLMSAGVQDILRAVDGGAQAAVTALEEAVVSHVGGTLVDDLAVLAVSVDVLPHG